MLQRTAIVENYGEAYSTVRNFKGKSKGAQEAHEAIRPTDMTRNLQLLENDQSKLYELIWKRTLASQDERCSIGTDQCKDLIQYS